MSNTFYTSDTHFGHAKCWEAFKNPDGSPMRPFTSTEEMDETMVDNWNRVVGKNDRVVHLGDVVINKKFLPVLDRLNGTKVLIIGNHDIHHLAALAPYFKEMTSMKVNSGMILTHVPVHPDQLPRFGTNVHGHLHNSRVMIEAEVMTSAGINDYYTQIAPEYETVEVIDPRYLCVCVEWTNYTPISRDELNQRITQQQEDAKELLPKMYEQMKGNKPWGNGSGPG